MADIGAAKPAELAEARTFYLMVGGKTDWSALNGEVTSRLLDIVAIINSAEYAANIKKFAAELAANK